MGWQIIHRDDVGLAHHHGAFDAVAQLPYIARPGVVVEDHPGFGFNGLDAFSVFLGELFYEGNHEQRNIFLALAKRWDMDVHHVETVVQIFPELTVLDGRFELPIGSGNHPYIHLDRFFAPDTLEGFVLQYPQQLDLHVLVDLSDFVEKDRPQMSELEASPFAGHRTGEGSPFMTEKFTFQKRFGEGGAVHLNQRLVSA